MAHAQHEYSIRVEWTGNQGEGTSDYRAYARSHEISATGKPVIPGSSDPAFRGDRTRYNPEELLVSSLSACHMLWYLHLCADGGIVVTGYVDDATGTMVATAETGGHFTEVVLRPTVTLRSQADADAATRLHEQAHHLCYIANSVRFPVRHEPRVQVEAALHSSGTP